MGYSYYAKHLAAERLKQCYELAPARIRRYLDAEVAHVLEQVPEGGTVLELGCGYGRVLVPLAQRAGLVVGIDTSLDSLRLARAEVATVRTIVVAAMDAVRPGLAAAVFDVVCCVQNGISSLHVDPRALMAEAVRVTRPGGTTLFSSYAESFWPERLEWFRIQAAHGLVGEIDEEATGDGVIACRDGFTATTFGPDELRRLAAGLGVAVEVQEVDGSSVFCEITAG